MAKSVDDVIDLLEEEQGWVLRESKKLHDVLSLLKESEERFSALKGNILAANEKALRKSVYRNLRKAVRFAKYISRTKRKLEKLLPKVYPSLPFQLRKKLSENDSLEKLEKFDTFILTKLDRNEGTVIGCVSKHGLKKDEMINEINETFDLGINPFLAVLENLVKDLENIKLEKEKIDASLPFFEIDLSELISTIGRRRKKVILMIDTSFIFKLWEVVKASKVQQKLFLQPLKEHVDEIIIPQHVVDELSSNKKGQSLIPQRIRSYLTGEELGAKIVKISPRGVELDYLVEKWKSTAKGQNSTLQQQQQFRRSADAKILTFPLQHPDEKVMVLANDTDITFIAKEMGYDVNVFMLDQRGKRLRKTA